MAKYGRYRLTNEQAVDEFNNFLSGSARAVYTAEIICGHPVAPEHRLREFRERDFRLLEGKTVLVVAHGGCIRTALIKLGYATQLELPGGSFMNAGYSVLRYDGKEFGVTKVFGVDTKALVTE